jgi:hypothetical protein
VASTTTDESAAARPVAQPDQAVRPLHDPGVVGGEEERGLVLVMERLHHVQEGGGRGGVEVGGRLVGEDQRRPGRDGPDHRHALLLAARELCRPAILHSREPHPGEQRPHPRATRGPRHALEQQDELGVLLRREHGHEVERLEHEAEPIEPQSRQGRRREDAEVLARHDHAAGVGAVEAAGHVQERGLARARGPRERDELPTLEREADVVERADELLTAPERATHVLEPEGRGVA